jgi:hypothetical protein
VATAERHLVFISRSSGYELAEREGEPPTAGTEIEDGQKRFLVSKVAASPLPGDERLCAYLEPT